MTNLFVLNFGMLLIVDAIFLLFCFLILSPFARYRHATYAVLRRNFFGYFAIMVDFDALSAIGGLAHPSGEWTVWQTNRGTKKV